MKRKITAATLGIGALLAAAFFAGGQLSGGGATPVNGSPAVTVTVTPLPIVTEVSDTHLDQQDEGASESATDPNSSSSDDGAADSGNEEPGATDGNNDGQAQEPAPQQPQQPAPQEPEQPAPQEPEEPQPEEPQPEPEDEGLDVELPEPVDEAPEVTASSISEGQTGVDRKTVFKLTFSEPMDTDSVEAALSLQANPLVLMTKPTITWNETATELTYKASGEYPYGSEMQILLGASAKDAGGKAMSEPFSRNFRIVRQSTIVLDSVQAYDGFVYAPPVDVLGPKVVSKPSLIEVGTWMRGFMTFDLSALPEDLIEITDATLQVRQHSAQAGAYGNQTGVLNVQSVFYGTLDQSDYSKPGATFGPVTLNSLLSNNATLEWKSADVLAYVILDWNKRDSQDHLSQYRLQFAKDNAGDGPDISVEWWGGKTVSPPKLTITYEHP